MPTLTYANLGKPVIPWTPKDLFAYGADGAWYDPTDLSTLFQDAAGTIPATAVGNPVGLMLDKSGRGRHVSQAVVAARPTLSRWPKGGRRNLLTWTEDFSNASAWGRTAVDIQVNATLAPDGSQTAAKLVPTAVSSQHTWLANPNSVTFTGGTTRSIYMKAGEYTFGSITTYYTGAPRYVAAVFNLTTGAVAYVTPGDTASISPAGDGWYRCSVTTSLSGATNFGQYQVRANTGTNLSNPGESFLGDGVSGIYIWHPQLEAGELTPYQKVTTANDVTEVGVPDVWHLSSDGIDDVLTTPWVGFAAPTELAWVGLSAATSGAGPAGLGIQYQLTARRFGTLASSAWLAAAPVPGDATGRDFVLAEGNLSSLAVYGVTATTDVLAARRNGSVLASKAPLPLGTAQTGTIRVGGGAGMSERFFGGVLASRHVTEQTRITLTKYLADRIGIAA